MYDADIDAIEQDIRNAEAELKQTTTAYSKTRPFPPGPNSHWGKGLAYLDAAEVKLEALRSKLGTPPPPPPPPPPTPSAVAPLVVPKIIGPYPTLRRRV